MTDPTSHGDARVVQPGAGEILWQPVPANGCIEIQLSPSNVRSEARFALGTQTIPPGCRVRLHAHDRVEEVIYGLEGAGRAVIDGVEHPLNPGTAIYLGLNRAHTFINDGATLLKFMWLVMPEGLETFFRAIGRAKTEGAPDPTPFPRPPNVLEIERATVFAPPPTS